LSFFENIDDTVRTCHEIIEAGIYPESFEIEDKSRFTLEGLAPMVDLQSPKILKLGLENIQAILLVCLGESQEMVRFQTSQIRKIASRNRGIPLCDKKILDLYWKSKTEISSWLSEGIGKSDKVHTCVPAISLNKVPSLERIYWRLSKKYRRLTPMRIGYYIILPNIECMASARMMFDDDST
jgi:hypothetical protein